MKDDILAKSKIIICLGTGGVGKTTTSAALALAAAKLGRRVCVVTIDPAKRLADAMGINEINNQPKKISTQMDLELWAVMLDPGSTFDELVQKFATSNDQVEKILNNRIYQNLVENLSGTQEYMAMEKIHQLHSDPRFDLIVVDTPPARSAVEFLNAPTRLIGFLDNRVFRLLISPNHSLGILRPVSVATRLLLRTISKVVGSQVVDDAVEFFQAFEGMEEGFRKRAGEMQDLLQKKTTAFVLVTGTHKDTIDEALFFNAKLGEYSLSVDAVISNRVTPLFDSKENPETDVPQELIDNLNYLKHLREAELSQLSRLEGITEMDQHILVPLLVHDIGSLEEIDEIGSILVDPKSKYSNTFGN